MAAKNEHKCNDFKEPSSLKELLDLYAALDVKNGTQCNVTNATKAVLEELKNRLTGKDDNGWIRNGNSGTGKDGADWFYKEGSSNSGNTDGCVMPKTILGLKELRKNILSNGKNDTYTLPDKDATTDPCVKKYADAIIDNAFPLFGCLFYLWFMCDNGDGKEKIGGGKKNGTSGSNGDWHWENEYVKGNTSNPDNLKDFLTDEQPNKGVNSVPMLTRGYGSATLNSTQGQKLFPKNGQALFDLKCTGGGNGHGHLQQALFFLLFLAPRWRHAMSGHALLFLDWFNGNAETVFSGVQWLHVKGAGQEYFQKCSELEQAIQNLGTGNGSGPNIAPVHTNSKDGNGSATGNPCNLYWPENGKGHGHGGKSILHNSTSLTNGKDNNGHRKAHVFMQYVSWLWWCIPHLTESLKEMKEDSTQWNNNGESFKHSTSFGPFAFGFTFTDNSWETANGKTEQLKEKLNKLISGIEQFKCCIEAFFWAIRRPFAYGSLAAWILAFTFLLYVHFMPLDLFHIQSHYNVFSFNRGPIRPLHEVSYFSGV